MKKKIIYLLSLFVFTFISCSNSLMPNEDALSVEVLKDQLKITNNSNETLYLFIVERKIAVVIDLIPQFGDPKVLKYDSIFINYSEIYKGSGEPVKSGDEVIIYYWG